MRFSTLAEAGPAAAASSAPRTPVALLHVKTPLRARGGALSSRAEAKDEDDEEDDQEEDDNGGGEQSSVDIRRDPGFAKLQAYRMKQQVLLQLRATMLSEAIAMRGIPLPTLKDVSTPEGVRTPEPIDWDCALSIKEDPYRCRYTHSAEEGTKVIAPMGETDKLDGSWIGISSLNRLRRKDPSKVDPMWHNKYTVLSSWFDADSEFSIYQHVGIGGLLLNSLLQGFRLPILMGLLVGMAIMVIMPILEYLVNRVLVSSILWMNWPTWARYARARLPFKMVLTQLFAKLLFGLFLKLVAAVKDQLVELECQILEDSIPLTVGAAVEKQNELDVELDEEMKGMLIVDEVDDDYE